MPLCSKRALVWAYAVLVVGGGCLYEEEPTFGQTDGVGSDTGGTSGQTSATGGSAGSGASGSSTTSETGASTTSETSDPSTTEATTTPDSSTTGPDSDGSSTTAPDTTAGETSGTPCVNDSECPDTAPLCGPNAESMGASWMSSGGAPVLLSFPPWQKVQSVRQAILSDSPSLWQVRGRLVPGEVLLSYVVGEESAGVFVLRPDRTAFVELPTQREELEDRIGRLLRPVQALRDGRTDLANRT